jgi:hypothetical protein
MKAFYVTPTRPHRFESNSTSSQIYGFDGGSGKVIVIANNLEEVVKKYPAAAEIVEVEYPVQILKSIVVEEK